MEIEEFDMMRVKELISYVKLRKFKTLERFMDRANAMDMNCIDAGVPGLIVDFDNSCVYSTVITKCIDGWVAITGVESILKPANSKHDTSIDDLSADVCSAYEVEIEKITIDFKRKENEDVQVCV